MNFHPWFNGLLHPLSVPAVSPPLLRSHPADCSPGSSNLLPGFRYIYLLKKERNKLLITCACSSAGAGILCNGDGLLNWGLYIIVFISRRTITPCTFGFIFKSMFQCKFSIFIICHRIIIISFIEIAWYPSGSAALQMVLYTVLYLYPVIRSSVPVVFSHTC